MAQRRADRSRTGRRPGAADAAEPEGSLEAIIDRRPPRERATLPETALLSAVLGVPVLLFGAVHAPVQRGLLVAFSLILLAVAARLRARGGSLRWHPLALAGAAFTLLALLQSVPLPIALVEAVAPTTAEATRATDALFGVTTATSPLTLAPGSTWDAAARWWLLTLGVLLLAQLLRRRAARRAALWVIAGLAALVLAVGVVQSLLGATEIYGLFTPEDPYAQVGPAGPFVGPNHAAHFLLLGGAVALALAPAACGWRRWVLLSLAVLSVVGILANGSRGALVALVVMTVAHLVYQWRRRRRTSPALAVLIIAFAAGGLVALESDALQSFFDLEQLGGQLELSKLKGQAPAFGLLDEAPLTGLGADAFGAVQMALAPSLTGNHLSYVENDYLQLLLDFGLLGLGAIGLVLVVARRSRGRVQEPANGEPRTGISPRGNGGEAGDYEAGGDGSGEGSGKRRRRARSRRRRMSGRPWFAVLPFLLYAAVSFALPVPALVLAAAAVFMALGGGLRRIPRRRGVDVALVASVVAVSTLFAASAPTRGAPTAETRGALASWARIAPLDGRHLWEVTLSGADLLTPAELDAAAERVRDLAGTDVGLRLSLARYWVWRGEPLLGWGQLEHVLALRGERGPWARDFLASIPDVTALVAICNAYPSRQELVFDELNRAGRHADALQVALALPDTQLILYNRIRASQRLGETELAAAFAAQLPREPAQAAKDPCRWHAQGLAVVGSWDAALAILTACLEAAPDDEELLALYLGWALRSRASAEATSEPVDAYLRHLNTLVGDNIHARRRYHRLRALANAREGACRAAEASLRFARASDGTLPRLPAWALERCPELAE